MTAFLLFPSRLSLCCLPVILGLTVPTLASAQVGEDLIVRAAVPEGFDRGRNISVTEKARPGYDALGIDIRSFRLFPQVEIGGGGTSNTYLTTTNKQAVPFLILEPSARLTSNWTRHFLQLTASAGFRDYLGQSRRNESVWEVDAQGRADLGSTVQVSAEADSSLDFESLFSGEVSSNVAALSRYRRDLFSLQGVYTTGRTRTELSADYTDYRFDSVRLQDDSFLDQSDRDRSISRLTGQFEFARSPSVSVFGQLGYSRTNYDRVLLSNVPNLDSDAYRFLVGVNFDIAGRMRGTVGVGYGTRNYDAAIYKTLSGFSAEGRLELFPSRLMTITLEGRRLIQDASLGSRNAFFDNRGSVRVDREVRRNLLVTGIAEYARQTYFLSTLRGDTARGTLGGRYLASRRLSLEANMSYTKRTSNDRSRINPLTEVRAQFGIVLQI